MKLNKAVSSSSRKARKAHFTAPQHVRRIMMSSQLSKELRDKYKTRSMPIRSNDEVLVIAGKHQNHEGKVTGVRRKKYVIYIDRLTRENRKGATRYIPVHPSNCVITKLHMDKDREAALARKGGNKTNMTD